MTDPVLVARAKIARSVQRHDEEGERLARHELSAMKIRRAVVAALADPYPPTDEAKTRLVTLLLTGKEQ